MSSDAAGRLRILHVVGARPNFMKAAPVVRALSTRADVGQIIVHTGQHYDPGMSEVFFQELSIPRPDVNLEVGSGSHAEQTAEVMKRLEPVLLERSPDLTLVYGDVNSTVAAALVCSKLLIPVGHVEAGLRSFDRTMPEEINRLITDQIADLLFTPSEDANENLDREGVPPSRVRFVGNVMIDTLCRSLPEAMARWPVEGLRPTRLCPLGLEAALAEGGRFGFATLHRPSNVDDPPVLREILAALGEVSRSLPLVFSVHPRTLAAMEALGLEQTAPGLFPVAPVGYLDALSLQARATVVITDSGGMQEETAYLGVPCITVRENTERPVTVSIGANVLVGRDMALLKAEVGRAAGDAFKRGETPPLWDGRSAERIADAILDWWEERRRNRGAACP